ncbi:hypothetical protein L207DRAFT_218301 [Hyaloscypha variabilis F]|uniref:Uncharacterized protein n=1 Tax=Hyaloscypha variabilis (strain UAMH 11265 / GT02V1 / F) TaxID=1149755 RepID=A0A2J6S7A7_HYAVF|nr:hypothetical protein L207DRAFT_218301 [Hyaloscypha variabilis F]
MGKTTPRDRSVYSPRPHSTARSRLIYLKPFGKHRQIIVLETIKAPRPLLPPPNPKNPSPTDCPAGGTKISLPARSTNRAASTGAHCRRGLQEERCGRCWRCIANRQLWSTQRLIRSNTAAPPLPLHVVLFSASWPAEHQTTPWHPASTSKPENRHYSFVCDIYIALSPPAVPSSLSLRLDGPRSVILRSDVDITIATPAARPSTAS